MWGGIRTSSITLEDIFFEITNKANKFNLEITVSLAAACSAESMFTKITNNK